MEWQPATIYMYANYQRPNRQHTHTHKNVTNIDRKYPSRVCVGHTHVSLFVSIAMIFAFDWLRRSWWWGGVSALEPHRNIPIMLWFLHMHANYIRCNAFSRSTYIYIVYCNKYTHTPANVIEVPSKQEHQIKMCALRIDFAARRGRCVPPKPQTQNKPSTFIRLS